MHESGVTDTYDSFGQLARHHTAGVDYKITAKDRASSTLVIAIHGGHIEPGTETVARAIAEQDLNLYTFEALCKEGYRLHVTSTAFDEPVAVSMASAATLCISIHGFAERSKHQVCVTGPHPELNDAVFAAICATGLIKQDTANPAKRFFATSPTNIMNRGNGAAVQIEISHALRTLLVHNPDLCARFAAAVRQATLAYTPPTPPARPKPPPPRPD